MSVIVPVEGEPPMTLVGLRLRLSATGALTVSVAALVTPPLEAEMATGVLADTGMVPTGKVTEV